MLALERFHELLLRINRVGATFIAAIDGSALGGGCELSLACDLRYMADGEFLIGQPEILLGIIPGGGGTQRLARLLGSGRALELVLEGSALSPAEALAAGLVNRVLPLDRLLDEAVETAQRLARRARIAVAAAKRAVYEGGSATLAHGLHVEQAGFMATLTSAAGRGHAGLRRRFEADRRAARLRPRGPRAAARGHLRRPQRRLAWLECADLGGQPRGFVEGDEGSAVRDLYQSGVGEGIAQAVRVLELRRSGRRRPTPAAPVRRSC